MHNPDLLLIDANSIGYAAMFQPELAKMRKEGASTAALHGLPASVMRIMRRFRLATPILLWDGEAQWRNRLYPEYKLERMADPGAKACNLTQYACTQGWYEKWHAHGRLVRQIMIERRMDRFAPDASTTSRASCLDRIC